MLICFKLICKTFHLCVTLLFLLVQAMESQIGDFYKDVGELGSLQGVCVPQQGLIAGDKEGGEQSGIMETRIVRLIEPLKERRRILLASKEMHQVAQDLEDEIVRAPYLWILSKSCVFISLLIFFWKLYVTFPWYPCEIQHKVPSVKMY